MTVEEIKARHQPHGLENQVEFDAIMSDINQQQGELNRPLIDRKMEIVKQRELLRIQKQAIAEALGMTVDIIDPGLKDLAPLKTLT